MVESLILQTVARLVKPLLLLFSIFLLLVGHNEPGGGFVGGLVAATGFALSAVAFGSAAARRALVARPRLLIGAGLLVALCAGLVGPILGLPLLTGVWHEFDAPLLGTLKVGTPLLFDVGVYFTVTGATLMLIFALMED